MGITWKVFPEVSLPHTWDKAAEDIEPIQRLAQTYFVLPPESRQQVDDLMQALWGEAYAQQCEHEGDG